MRAHVQGSAENAYSPELAAGQYLTDEVFLYRVVGFGADEGSAMVQLEDCYWLDIVSVPMARVLARRLRAVTPGASASFDELRVPRLAPNELAHAQGSPS
jgi:hypothetical protein